MSAAVATSTLRALRNSGLSYARIAARTGLSAAAVEGRLRRAADLRRAAARRPCLCCHRPFVSEGAHHRLCAECRRSRPARGAQEHACHV